MMATLTVYSDRRDGRALTLRDIIDAVSRSLGVAVDIDTEAAQLEIDFDCPLDVETIDGRAGRVRSMTLCISSPSVMS